jgi:hypothetical protein
LFDLPEVCRETLNQYASADVYAQTGELETVEFRRFRQMSTDLEWLALFLRAGAERAHAKVEKPHWEQAEQKRIRIWLARCLAVVFESAYDRKPIVKNGGSNDKPESFGLWADFFCRVLRAAHIESAGANLKEVLDEARRLHRAERVLFEPGILPE